MFTKSLIGLALILLPALAVAVPLPRPLGSIEYQFVARGAALGERCPEIPFKATRHRDSLLLQRDGGSQPIEALIGPEIRGDFLANLEVEVAGFQALGIQPNGGTPVPYFGFRSCNGKDAEYFTLDTVMDDWKTFTLEIRRQGEKIIAQRGGHEYRASAQGCREPGHVVFLMNDIAKLKIRRCEIRGLSAPDPFAMK
jgi:hypothetical protein